MGKNTKLSPKRKRFCEEYVIDHNKTQAYIRAGYSKNGAGQGADRLYNFVEVKAYIDRLEAKETARLAKKYEVTQERIIKERSMIAFFRADMLYDENGEKIPPHKWPEHVSAAVEGIRGGEVKTHSKDSSLQALEKIIGMYEKDNSQKRELKDWSKEELTAEAKRLMKDLGLK